MKIELSSKFQKAYKKLIRKRPDVAIIVLNKILLFSQEPTAPSLGLHKLKGQLEGVYSFSIEENLRIIVDLKDSTKALFVNIGTHDEVYNS